MHLFVNGHVLPISHLGPEFVILRNPVEHGPTDAEISLSIDGNERRWTVHLINGIQADRVRTLIAPVGAAG